MAIILATLDSVAPNEKRRPGKDGVNLELPGARLIPSYTECQSASTALPFAGRGGEL